MPAVKATSAKTRKAPAKKGAKGRAVSGRVKVTRTQGRALARTGARADELFARAWAGFLSYAAVGVTALGLVALFALFAGGYFHDIGARIGGLTEAAARGVGFTVSRVTVKGAAELTEREVMQALWSDRQGSVLGRSLLHVDAQEARQRIEAVGAVRYAAVTKLWPNTLHVSVRERTPEALWQDGAGVLHLIDADGVSLRPVGPTDRTDLPVITGTSNPAGALDIMEALRARPALLASVAAIVSVRDRRYDIRFRNDFTAKLPEETSALP